MSATPVFSNPSRLVAPVGPYSHVSRVGDLVYLAGQTGIDDRGDLVGPGIAEQTRQAFENIRLALESEGLSLAHVMKLTTYVAGAEHLPGIEQYMADSFPELFPASPPPNTLLVVSQLFVPELRVEVDAVAHA